MNLISLHLKIYFKNRRNLFWILLVPILVGLFVYLAYGEDIENPTSSIPVGVVRSEGNQDYQIYQWVFDEVKWIKPVYMGDFEAEDKLQNKEICGIIRFANEPTLTTLKNTPEVSLIKNLMEEVAEKKQQYEDNDRSENLDKRTVKSWFQVMGNETVSLKRDTEFMNGWFFMILAAASFFCGLYGIQMVSELSLDQRTVGEAEKINQMRAIRVRMGERRLPYLANAKLAAGLFLSANCLLGLVFFFENSYGVDFGERQALLLFNCYFCTFAGITFGMALGCFSRFTYEGKRILLLLLTTFFYLIAGPNGANWERSLFGDSLFLTKLNPLSVIQSSFFELYYHTGLKGYIMDALWILVFSVVCATTVIYHLRKQTKEEWEDTI